MVVDTVKGWMAGLATRNAAAAVDGKKLGAHKSSLKAHCQKCEYYQQPDSG